MVPFSGDIRSCSGEYMFQSIMFGQIIATSHIFSPQKVAEVSGNPLMSGKSRLVNYYDLARSC